MDLDEVIRHSHKRKAVFNFDTHKENNMDKKYVIAFIEKGSERRIATRPMNQFEYDSVLKQLRDCYAVFEIPLENDTTAFIFRDSILTALSGEYKEPEVVPSPVVEPEVLPSE